MTIKNALDLKVKKRGFSLLEVVFALGLFSLILSLTIKPFKTESFQREIRDKVFMNQLKSAITDQRIRAVREHSIGYYFVLNGTGSVRFIGSGKEYLVIDDPIYRVKHKSGQWTSILTTTDFKNQTNNGQNAFTILIFRKDQLMGELVFQVGTSTFREKYYGTN
ncbi:MAG: type II secretion system protein [Clostridium sp.]|jgi:prepilin-type N-terminal cleavage/methylation domain-containing protein|nr:type II secretion system protein [Clostridium sp.]